MISLILFFACIPGFMGYNASKYDIEACYKIIKPGSDVLVGFRFPTFNSLYPTVIYMTIERKYCRGYLRNISIDIFQFELKFHSLKCKKTMEISHFGGGSSSKFTIYLGVDTSSQYLTKYDFILDINTENQLHVIEDHFRHADLFIYFRSGSSETKKGPTACFLRYDTLNIFNTTRSTTVAVIFVVISQHNSSYGDKLFTLTLKGWRLNCPSTIPLSMLIEDVVFDSSWNEIKIEISIQDLFDETKETSVIRIENGLTTNIPENEVVFPGLNFIKIRPIDYLWYSREIQVQTINILPLFRLRMTMYECEIYDQEMILTEYTHESNIIERCMITENNYAQIRNISRIKIWENVEHSYASLCIRRCHNKFSLLWDEYTLGFISNFIA
ncbi:hypothetical protein RF11_10122 [Thelohanellus kitauei]|uniref:CUB domain-containing protein n=1 Tax=Thelohanellus kitauei TaxID=669202 RepID=A0A0C2MNQ1_THEKT|nr:hypothetical protein RF11_10122 [Thelohanellus kitauei]